MAKKSNTGKSGNNNKNLHKAKAQKNDEFYTQYEDIQNEMNAYIEYNPDVFRDKVILCPCDDPEWSNFTKFFVKNFEAFGIKKLISTSYAIDSKNKGKDKDSFIPHQLTFDEAERPDYNEEFSKAHGKVFILDRNSCTFPVNENNLEWYYLKGDGDFRSEEVTKLRDEADFIITNEPFSLFREFLAWIIEADKKFIIIGNANAITYKEVFPIIKDNKLWLGATKQCSGSMWFSIPSNSPIKAGQKTINNIRYQTIGSSAWFTNVDHAKRHRKMELMTMADNIRYNKSKKFADEGYYKKYDNYDALNCPLTDVIPSDYDGVMGVPISFLDKYNPEQFEIIGSLVTNNPEYYSYGVPYIDGKKVYARILIKRKEINNNED